MRLRNLFISTFAITLSVQALLWSTSSVVDENTWVKRIEHLVFDATTGFSQYNPTIYSGHPGTPALLLAAATSIVGVPAKISLYVALSLIVATGTAGIYTVLAYTYPQNRWWLFGGSIVMFSLTFLHTTPIDVVMIAFIPLIFALGLTLLTTEKHASKIALWLGLALSIALATRLHVSIILCAPLTIALAITTRKTLLQTLAIASIATPLLLSFLWIDPVSLLHSVTSNQTPFVTGIQHTGVTYTTQIRLRQFLLSAPFSLISLTFFILATASNRLRLSYPFVISLLSATFLLTITIGSLSQQSIRYFFPILVVWEMLLPKFIADLLPQQTLRSIRNALAFKN